MPGESSAIGKGDIQVARATAPPSSAGARSSKPADAARILFSQVIDGVLALYAAGVVVACVRLPTDSAAVVVAGIAAAGGDALPDSIFDVLLAAVVNVSDVGARVTVLADATACVELRDAEASFGPRAACALDGAYVDGALVRAQLVQAAEDFPQQAAAQLCSLFVAQAVAHCLAALLAKRFRAACG